MAIEQPPKQVTIVLQGDRNQRYLLKGQLAKLEVAEVQVSCPYPKDPSRSTGVEQWAMALKLVSTIPEQLV